MSFNDSVHLNSAAKADNVIRVNDDQLTVLNDNT